MLWMERNTFNIKMFAFITFVGRRELYALKN